MHERPDYYHELYLTNLYTTSYDYAACREGVAAATPPRYLRWTEDEITQFELAIAENGKKFACIKEKVCVVNFTKSQSNYIFFMFIRLMLFLRCFARATSALK